jgi:hypothetical protein
MQDQQRNGNLKLLVCLSQSVSQYLSLQSSHVDTPLGAHISRSAAQ